MVAFQTVTPVYFLHFNVYKNVSFPLFKDITKPYITLVVLLTAILGAGVILTSKRDCHVNMDLDLDFPVFM